MIVKGKTKKITKVQKGEHPLCKIYQGGHLVWEKAPSVKIKLATPDMKKVDGVLTWNVSRVLPEGCIGYEFYWIEGDNMDYNYGKTGLFFNIKEVVSNSHVISPGSQAWVRALGDGKKYANSDWIYYHYGFDSIHTSEEDPYGYGD